ncbi:MAG: helix-turn-helix transcriptional regulator [Clostridia bacterium]|nr:helix-turn-helix transcriptional regulator [Clostridia bacterium]
MQRESLGVRIKEVRKQRKLTQQELAEKVNISDVYIGEIERGIKMPSIPVFIDIIKALDISADYLLRDTVPSGMPYINNEITQKLDKLNPKQRKTVVDIIDAYIKNI